jgi:hypothetical protein
MGERKVYISSTFKDLENARQDIIQAISDRDILGDYYDTAYIMESMKTFGRSETALEQCLSAVRSADVYILIIGNWYGSMTEYQGISNSYTEHEYTAAIRSLNYPRIYILHSDITYDNDNSAEVSRLCAERNIPPEENAARVAAFKQLTLQNRAKAVSFSSLKDLQRKIDNAFVGDIAYYFLYRKMNEFKLSNMKLPYYIDRVPQNILLDTAMEGTIFEGIYPILLPSIIDNKPEAYAKRVMYDKCPIPTYAGPIRSGASSVKLASFYNKEGKKELADYVDLLIKTQSIGENGLFSRLDGENPASGGKIRDVIQFEVAITDQQDGLHWIRFIDEFIGLLLEARDGLKIFRVFIFVHLLYTDQTVVEKTIKTFTAERYINLRMLGNIKYADIVDFFKEQVLEITADDSEENRDKQEELKRLVNALDVAISMDDELTYYRTTKVLNLKIG